MNVTFFYVVWQHFSKTVSAPDEAEIEIDGKKCKWCGSSNHLRISHKDCSFSPKKIN